MFINARRVVLTRGYLDQQSAGHCQPVSQRFSSSKSGSMLSGHEIVNPRPSASNVPPSVRSSGFSVLSFGIHKFK